MPVDPSRRVGDPQTRVAGTRTAELFEEHSRMVYGLCRALLRDPDDADDATQATFVSAYTSLLGGGVVREPAAWLATIARNECTARARARMREPLPLLDADLGRTHGPEAELERKTVVAELQNAISKLPEKQREAIVLRDLYGLRYTEVSAALGMSIASVESLLFRARRSLRVSLKPLASGALTVPVAVREGIAQALPAFATGRAAGGGAASGAVGLGLLAKLTGGPAAVKAAAGLAAAVAAGSITVGEVVHRDRALPAGGAVVVRTQPPDTEDARAVGDASALVLDRNMAVESAHDHDADQASGSGRGGGKADRGASVGRAGESRGEESDAGSKKWDKWNDSDSREDRSGGTADDGGTEATGTSGRNRGASGSEGSGDDDGPDEDEAPEGGDDLLEREISSASSSSDSDDSDHPGPSGGSGSDELGEPREDESAEDERGEEDGRDDPDGGPALTTPPPT